MKEPNAAPGAAYEKWLNFVVPLNGKQGKRQALAIFLSKNLLVGVSTPNPPTSGQLGQKSGASRLLVASFRVAPFLVLPSQAGELTRREGKIPRACLPKKSLSLALFSVTAFWAAPV